MAISKNIRGIELSLLTDSPGLNFFSHHCEKVEPEVFDFIDTLTPSDSFLDLGACEGRYSLYAAKRGIPTISIEPETKNYAALCEHITLNNLQNIKTLNLAIGRYSHAGKLVVGQDFAGGHHKIVEDAVGRDKLKGNALLRQEVEIKALDELGLTPTAIKIDVDGSELEVLEGGQKTIAGARQVMIELYNTDLHFLKCRGLLYSWGFTAKQAYVINYPQHIPDLFNFWMVKVS